MLQKSTTQKVLEVFFNEPTKKHNLKEISNKISTAHTSIKKILITLVQDKIILQENEKRGKRQFPFFMANFNDIQFKNLKKINNLEQIYSSKIIHFTEANLMPKSIILFGSYSRGEDIEDSDIDIFLETSEKIINLQKFEKKLNRKINLYFKEDINKCSKEFKNNLINGIILEGAIELK